MQRPIARLDERWIETWRRRALSIPVVFLLGLTALAILPITAGLAALAAPFERHHGAKLRCVGFFTTYLAGEMLFLTIAFGQWLAARPWTTARRARLEKWTRWLGDSWGGLLHASGRLFFSLR